MSLELCGDEEDEVRGWVRPIVSIFSVPVAVVNKFILRRSAFKFLFLPFKIRYESPGYYEVSVRACRT